MKILFSVPVHENMDVVCNIVENIQKFVKEPIIVFHVNPIFRDFDPGRLKEYPNVIVNPNRLSFVKYHSILHILMVNYYHTRDIEYDYHCFFYSNEMFIKPGIEHYIGDSDYVLEKWFTKLPFPRFDEMVKSCSKKDFFDSAHIINNHVEGTMYRKNLIGQIFDFVNENMIEILQSTTSIEEIVIPTLAYKFAPTTWTGPYNFFQEWDREPTIDQVDYLLTKGNNCYVGHIAQEVLGKTDQIFTIKPVHRYMESPLRQYINRL